MPGISFIGSAPQKKSQTAEFMKGLVDILKREQEEDIAERTMALKEKGESLEERRLGMLEETHKLNLENIEYNKKKQAADMVIAVAETLGREEAATLLNQPDVRELFDNLGWPLPIGISSEKTVKEQALEAVQEGRALEGMTIEETKKLAGVHIAPKTITEKDIKETPWELADWIPWKESTAEKLRRLRRERRMGKSTTTPPSVDIDPLEVYNK